MQYLVFKKSAFISTSFFLLLWLVALLRTYAPERDYQYTKHGALVFIVLVGLMLVIWGVKRKGVAKKGGCYFFIWLSVLWGLFSISTILNISYLPVESIFGLFNNLIWQAFVFLFALLWVSKDNRFDIQLAAVKIAFFFGGFGLVAALAAVQLLLTKQTLVGPMAIIVNDLQWPQLYGWFASPNYLVDAVAIGVVASFYLYISGHLNRFFSMAFLLLMLLFLVGTGSRGGILGTVAALIWQFGIILIAQHGLRKKLRLVGRYLVITFFSATVGVLSLLAYVSVMGKGVTWFLLNVLRLRPENLSTGTGRIYIWQDGLEVFLSGSTNQFLFGIGNNAYVEGYGVSLHNTYLQILIDHGILTLVAFLFFSTWFFWVAVKLTQRFRYHPGSQHAVAFLSASAAYVIVRAVFQGPVFLSGNISWAFMIVAGVVMSATLFSRVQAEGVRY